MILLLIIFITFVTAKVQIRTHTSQEYLDAWTDFLAISEVRERDTPYLTEQEHDERFEIFKDNLETIKAHNNLNHTWTMGVTQFADMTAAEFRTYSSCVAGSEGGKEDDASMLTSWNRTSLTSVDWVKQGAVTSVKNQGSCGSCWAFSTTGAIESRYKIATGNLVSLSEQELVSCSKQTSGCNGGWPANAMNFAIKKHGLCKESSFRYKGKSTICWDLLCRKYDRIRSYAYVAQSTAAMETAVAAGPVSIVIEASLQFYKSGVMTSQCGTSYNHAVLLVGYGTDSKGGDYWKVKNSWGANWGEEGYFRLCRNCNRNNGLGQCGILGHGVVPLV